MSLELIGFIIDTLGKILVAFTAIRVHGRFWKEHKIDAKVFREMRTEQVLGMLGIAMIVIGFILELPGKM
jgi:hypothetical protein